MYVNTILIQLNLEIYMYMSLNKHLLTTDKIGGFD